MLHRIAYWICFIILIVGCGKGKKAPKSPPPPISPFAKSPSNQEPNNAAVMRSHVFAISDAVPPITNKEPETVKFNVIGDNEGKAYDHKMGKFTPPRDGYYQVSSILNYPVATTATEDRGVCQLHLSVAGVQISGAFATAPYLRGQPCSVQITMKLKLRKGETVELRAKTSLTGLTFPNGQYTYGLLEITED